MEKGWLRIIPGISRNQPLFYYAVFRQLLTDLRAGGFYVLIHTLFGLVLVHPQLLQNLASALLGDAFEEHGLSEGFHRLIILHVLNEGNSQTVIRNRIVWLRLNSREELLLRWTEFLLMQVNQAQRVVRLRGQFGLGLRRQVSAIRTGQERG